MGEETAFRDFARRLAADGDAADRDEAAREILARYSAQLVALARGQLSPRLRAKVDPEDVFQSVLRTFFRRLSGGRVELRGWDGLWGFLALVTLRKCQKNAARFGAAARDVAREVSLRSGPDGDGAWEVTVPDRAPAPEEATVFLEELDRLLSGLHDRDREAVERILAGESLPAAAAQAHRSERTVRRAFELVRKRLTGSRGGSG